MWKFTNMLKLKYIQEKVFNCVQPAIMFPKKISVVYKHIFWTHDCPEKGPTTHQKACPTSNIHKFLHVSSVPHSRF